MPKLKNSNATFWVRIVLFFFEYRAKNTFFFYFTSLTLSWLILDPLVVEAVVVLVVPPLLALEE